MVSSQEVLIRDLFSILEREVGIQSYKVIVVFTTARLTGVLAEMFNSVSAQTGYKALLEMHSRNTQKQRERGPQSNSASSGMPSCSTWTSRSAGWAIPTSRLSSWWA